MRRALLFPFLAVLSIAGLAAAAESYWAQATFVRGSVTVTSGGAASPLALGAVLHRGDKVAAAAGASATFLQPDGSLVVVRSGKEVELGGSAKGEDRPALGAVAANLSKSLLSREGNNPMLKHLGGLRGSGRNAALWPNRTKVRVGSPVTFAWNAVPGVRRYVVTLMGPDDSIVENTVTVPKFELAAGKLAAGETYFWEVRDADSPEAITALGSGTFTALDKAAEAEVARLEQGIGTAFPASGDDATPVFLRYQLYREHGLAFDAMKALSKLSAGDPQNGEISRWRTQLATELGLSQEALSGLPQS